MTNKIVAIQGNHPSKLNPKTDTSVFLANEIRFSGTIAFNLLSIVDIFPSILGCYFFL